MDAMTFELNDRVTWRKVEVAMGAFMEELKCRMAFVDYRVMCDETTNPPTLINDGGMCMKVLWKPTLACELIEQTFTLLPKGHDHEIVQPS